MTRGQLQWRFQNRGENPKVLYWYHNGDQYPSGIRDFYNIKQFLDNYTREGFIKWLVDQYEATPEGIKTLDTTLIYYDDAGFLVDYSYIFEPNEIKVYNWDKQIFKGNLEAFKKWIAKQELG